MYLQRFRERIRNRSEPFLGGHGSEPCTRRDVDVSTGVHRFEDGARSAGNRRTLMWGLSPASSEFIGVSVEKREVLLMDEFGTPFGLTLWDPNLNVFDGKAQAIVSVSNVRLRRFRDILNGNLTESSVIEFDSENERSPFPHPQSPAWQRTEYLGKLNHRHLPTAYSNPAVNHFTLISTRNAQYITIIIIYYTIYDIR